MKLDDERYIGLLRKLISEVKGPSRFSTRAPSTKALMRVHRELAATARTSATSRRAYSLQCACAPAFQFLC